MSASWKASESGFNGVTHVISRNLPPRGFSKPQGILKTFPPPRRAGGPFSTYGIVSAPSKAFPGRCWISGRERARRRWP
jgi:hypothetical protein